MSVYVDSLRSCPKTDKWPYSMSCHLVADTAAELIYFAGVIGLKMQWFQEGASSLPHFDLTKGMRIKALDKGAVEIGTAEIVEMIRASRSNASQAQAPEARAAEAEKAGGL